MWTWTYCRNLPAFNHSDWDALFQLSEEKLFCFMETNFKTRTKLYFPDWWRAHTCLMAEYNPQSSGSGFSCLLLWKEAQVLKCHFAKKKKKKREHESCCSTAELGCLVIVQYKRTGLQHSEISATMYGFSATSWEIRQTQVLFLFIYLFFLEVFCMLFRQPGHHYIMTYDKAHWRRMEAATLLSRVQMQHLFH